MTTKSLIRIAALTLMICMCSRPAVIAGSPLPLTSRTTGTSTVRGAVRLDGTAPSPAPVNMAADPICAKQHPTPVLSQDVVTEAQGNLQNVVVFIAEGLGDQTFELPSQPVVIDQRGCMYQPHVLAMRANQRLEVVNHDPTSHNIHPIPANNREWNKSEPPGSKAEETFLREEVAIPVKCNIHPWMRAYVAVFKHPYFAVTGKDGSFDLRNLPAGTYTIKAWHEKLGTSIQKITVGANETKVIDFVLKPQGGV
jgi:plastocyanin